MDFNNADQTDPIHEIALSEQVQEAKETPIDQIIISFKDKKLNALNNLKSSFPNLKGQSLGGLKAEFEYNAKNVIGFGLAFGLGFAIQDSLSNNNNPPKIRLQINSNQFIIKAIFKY